MKTLMNAEKNHHDIIRSSRWIKVRHDYNITKRSKLYDSCTDGNGYRPYQAEFDPENGTYLDYFIWNNRKYALTEFMPLNGFWGFPTAYIENGEKHYLSAYDDPFGCFRPMMIEFDECCENLRVYFHGTTITNC